MALLASECPLIMVKPDGVQQWLVGEVMEMKMLQVPESVIAEHYQDLQEKHFSPTLLSYMSSGPMVATVCTSRAMIMATDSYEAAPRTIWGDVSAHISRNVIHASDSIEGAI